MTPNNLIFSKTPVFTLDFLPHNEAIVEIASLYTRFNKFSLVFPYLFDLNNNSQDDK